MTNIKLDHQAVRKALAELGEGPDEIAERLSDLGVMGISDPANCPIHNYLVACFPGVADDISVNSRSLHIDGVSFYDPLVYQFVHLFTTQDKDVHDDLPPQIWGFIENFDADLYPELISEDDIPDLDGEDNYDLDDEDEVYEEDLPPEPDCVV